MEPLLTTEDIAEFFRVDVVTVRRMINKGELTAYRVGGEYRFARADIDDYLERQRLPAKAVREGRLAGLTRRARKLASAGPLTEGFERFTQRARSVLDLAQEEACSLGHASIGTEHLVLGVLREAEGVGARLLREAGCDLAGMRRLVRHEVGGGLAGKAVQGEMPLTPRLKKVLQCALEEAERLDHAYVGTEHLVLGLLREGEGVAGRALREVGMDLDTARKRVHELLAGNDEG